MFAELLCGAVALVLYVNTLGADFCYDDSRAIKTNQDLLPETPWTNIFYDDFWGTLLTHSGSHKSYRPLCTLSFRLNHAVGGLEPWGYHLVNVAVHGAVTGLFTCLARLLLGGGLWSLLAWPALCLSPHPHRGTAGSRWALAARGLVPGSLGCAACSMLWKELGVTVLAISALYDVCVFHRLKLRQVITLLYKRKNVHLLLNVFLLAAWGAILLACRFYWMGNKPPNFSNSDNPAADSPSFLTRMLTFFYLPAVNFWLLLCPDTLSFDWSMDALPLIRTLADWRNFHTVAFYLGLILLAWFSLWTHQPAKGKETNGKAHHYTNGRNGNSNGHSYQYNNHEHMNNSHTDAHVNSAQNGTKKHYESRTPLPTSENVVVFSLGLLAIPFLPATNVFFYVGFVIAERVLYIPSMGFCLLVAVGMRSLYVRLRRRSSRTMLVYCSAALVLLFSVKTVLRNQDWQNEEMLYKSGIYVNPAKAWGNLGNVLKSQGKMEEAEQAYRNALYYRSNMADMLYNLGLLLQESNKFSEALHYYKLAIGSRPTLASAYLNTGIILMNQGRLDEAKRTFLTCADIPDENLKDPHAHKSSVTSCLYNLGKLLHEQGHQEEALTVFKEAIQKMPRQFAPQSLYNMMGEAYIRLNKLTEAEHWYRESLRAKPDHIPAHLTYGKLLAMTHLSMIKTSAGSRLAPASFIPYLRTPCGTAGQKTEAERYFLKAIQLDPTKGNCYMHYGQFLLEESRLLEAAEMAEKAARLDSREFDVVFSAAHMLRQASLNEAAEKYYGQAASLRPNYPAALMNLGAILHLNGKLQEAEANYLRALQLKPDDTITQSNLRKLWNIMEKQGLRTTSP
ncbi:Transmembrane and TPR repeat-containing protein 2 [Collichthys lucidus]|uniref:dolichyl-phosphate-mannose--protein mannosyltransferase n=1 Tax=Collichthys lucidus TaxID=240159 RepID=A0A4U5UI62_COLLU|nr:Transmembrane and TPR repeat-containing protein 2 [Collichthys lucidus]